MNSKIYSFIIISALFLQSCATLFTGSRQNIQISSIPNGARIQVNGIDRGVTPSIVKLKKGFEGPLITLKKDGYETKTFQPETSFNPVSALNLLFLLAWAVDAATGAMVNYNPSLYEIYLDPSGKIENTK